MKLNSEDKSLEIDITDYWMIIRKRFLLIILIFIFVLSLVVTFTLRQRPEYESVCKIKISSRQPMATIEGAQIAWYGSSGNALNSEIKLMKSKDALLEAVIHILQDGCKCEYFDENKIYYPQESIDLINDLSFADGTSFIDNLTVSSLRGTLDITQEKDSNIVAIKANTPFRKTSESIANILAVVYRADFWKNKTQEALNTMNFIKEQLNQIQTELEKARETGKKKHKEDVFLGSQQIFKDELSRARIELKQAKEKYQVTHPRIIKLKNLIASLEDQLAKFPKTVQAYDHQKAEIDRLQSFIEKYGEHLMAAKINYEAKKEKARDEIQIISFAEGANKVKPDEMMNYIAGVLFGLILGCVFAFVWEGLDTSIGKIEDVERITGLPVIAHIPFIGLHSSKSNFFKPARILFMFIGKMLMNLVPFEPKEKPPDFEKKLLFNFSPLSIESEAYRTLRTNIHFAIGTGKQTGNVIAITSTCPKEGKTLTSTNLAIGLAQMGRMTLLLEADMRRPQTAGLFKIDETPGLSDLLIGTANRDNAIRTITDILMGKTEWDQLTSTQGIDNLHILPCGTIPPNPSELLLSPEFKELLAEFENLYDFVIIDTPPTLPVSDSSIISTVVDGTVLIYQSDTTSRHLLLRAIQTLEKNQAKLLGIIINQLSFDVVMKSSGVQYNYSKNAIK